MAALLNLNILLAEDDENDAILIQRAFKRLDCLAHLTTAPDGDSVIAYLRGDHPYDDRARWPFPGVVILDHSMPRMSGLEVLCWIRTEPRFCNLPAVLLSGSMPPDIAAALGKLKAAYCPKSISLVETVSNMNQAMADALTLARGGWFRTVETPPPVASHMASLPSAPGLPETVRDDSPRLHLPC